MNTDMEPKKNSNIMSTVIIGGLIVALILALGTFTLGNKAGNDSREAVRISTEKIFEDKNKWSCQNWQLHLLFHAFLH